MKIATILTNIFHYIHLSINVSPLPFLINPKTKTNIDVCSFILSIRHAKLVDFTIFNANIIWNFLVFLQLDFLPIL